MKARLTLCTIEWLGRQLFSCPYCDWRSKYAAVCVCFLSTFAGAVGGAVAAVTAFLSLLLLLSSLLLSLLLLFLFLLLTHFLCTALPGRRRASWTRPPSSERHLACCVASF